MNGSGGVGFVIDTATLFLFLIGISVLASIWLWLRKKGQRKLHRAMSNRLTQCVPSCASSL